MRRSGKWFFALGGLLLVCSLGLILTLQVKTNRAERANGETVRVMEQILPQRREGAKDPERRAEMPVLEIGGENFIALLEIPAYGVGLPVSAQWDRGTLVSHPCRFSGSAYHGTLVIGGYDRRGQFDFFERISDGASVTVTDMTGAVFTYTVERVDRSDSAGAEVLTAGGWDLTLFVRDAQLLEYIILRCMEK